MDFLYMGNAEESDLKYVLVLKYHLICYTWLLPFASPNTEAVTDRLSSWVAAFETVVWIVTDREPHFVTNVLQGLIKDAGINHHKTSQDTRLLCMG